ncbi:universal stress protein [Streptomyces sp. NPDC059582]|uniref:universal stress protein n=1 Tax=Streptomyces sp. NPDC059582 TaxID=3346875 RepID=UPI0036B22A41
MSGSEGPTAFDGPTAFEGPTAARVVVGVSGSPGSISALRRAAKEARRRDAELWPVLAWEPPGGELSALRHQVPNASAEQWQHLARERLLTVLGEVFGDAGPSVGMRALVARGAPGPALVEIADGEDDILVVGAGQRSQWHRACSRSISRYCLAHATCPVLAVPPSPLESELAAVHRRNAWRLRLDTRTLARETETVPPDA